MLFGIVVAVGGILFLLMSAGNGTISTEDAQKFMLGLFLSIFVFAILGSLLRALPSKRRGSTIYQSRTGAYGHRRNGPPTEWPDV